MNRQLVSRSVTWSLVGLFALGSANAMFAADTTPAKKPTAEAPEKTAKVSKANKKKAGRLPAHYSQIVDEQQREKLLAIEAKHSATLAKLRSDLKAEQQKLASEMAAILSPEQQSKLAELKAETKAKRKAANGKKVKATAGAKKKLAKSKDATEKMDDE